MAEKDLEPRLAQEFRHRLHHLGEVAMLMDGMVTATKWLRWDRRVDAMESKT